MRVPFIDKRQSPVRVGRRQTRDARDTMEVLTWAGASFLMGYLAFAAALGFFAQ